MIETEPNTDIIHSFGCLKNPPDHRDYKAVALSKAIKALPDSVDLRPKWMKAFDQGSTNSCATNAGVQIFMYEWWKETGIVPPLMSREFVYWWARKIGRMTGDNGSDIRSVF